MAIGLAVRAPPCTPKSATVAGSASSPSGSRGGGFRGRRFYRSHPRVRCSDAPEEQRYLMIDWPPVRIVSDLDPAGGLESGVLGNGSSLVAQRLGMCPRPIRRSASGKTKAERRSI